MSDQDRRNPYTGLPDRQFWKQDPALLDPLAFDPVTDVPFDLSPTDRVVTAGSCFAQHLGMRLARAGFDHHIAEPAHPMIPEDLARTYSYGVFSCRYGNIYTARQLLQLLRRAWGDFIPQAVSWLQDPRAGGDRVVDPFRPRIQPKGFVSEPELLADRRHHFAAIRRAFTEMDVFVFTLGLTECWEDPRDGAILPLAPGVAGGIWREGEAVFRNFDEVETADDLAAALKLIRAINPGVRIILTVSPVPLNATYLDRHVFVSTTWSKAALRIAAERVCRAVDRTVYFPSYEIITAPHLRGRYYAEDAREVRPDGVDHVMRLFLKHFAKIEGEPSAVPDAAALRRADARAEMERLEGLTEVLCDEQSITNRPS